MIVKWINETADGHYRITGRRLSSLFLPADLFAALLRELEGQRYVALEPEVDALGIATGRLLIDQPRLGLQRIVIATQSCTVGVAIGAMREILWSEDQKDREKS